jgi:predicted Rossmann fold flavoprotein
VQDIAGLKLVIDLKPALDDQILDKRLLREFNENPNKQLNNLLKNLLPQKMIEPVIKLSRIEPDRAVNSIRKDERKNLLHILKNLTFTLTRFRPLKEAIITSGGVLVNEIDPRTMESRIVDDLYFAGEIIDVDSHTGGFNLQIAFATGFLAGSNA